MKNQYFVARAAVERDDATTGAVSELICGVGDGLFAGNAFQQVGQPIAS